MIWENYFIFFRINPFSFAITWLHVEHFSVLRGIYAGKKTCSLESGMPALTNIFSTSIPFQLPQFLHFTPSFIFTVITQIQQVFSDEIILLIVTLEFLTITLPEHVCDAS